MLSSNAHFDIHSSFTLTTWKTHLVEQPTLRVALELNLCKLTLLEILFGVYITRSDNNFFNLEENPSNEVNNLVISTVNCSVSLWMIKSIHVYTYWIFAKSMVVWHSVNKTILTDNIFYCLMFALCIIEPLTISENHRRLPSHPLDVTTLIINWSKAYLLNNSSSENRSWQI